MPGPVGDAARRLWKKQRRPAWLRVDDDGALVESGGALERYGLSGVAPGTPVADAVPVLAGLFPCDAATAVECVEVSAGVYADVHALPGGWVLLLDATAGAEQRQALQQRANEVSLLKDDLDRRNRLLEKAQARSDELLRAMLPASIAGRMQAGEREIADAFDEATLLYSDIAGFPGFVERMEARALAGLLNRVFAAFDGLTEKHGLEPLKTHGDVYVCAAGVPEPRKDHAEAAAALALDMQRASAGFSDPDGRPLSLRIGLHSGPVVAGIVGTRRLAYDLWGDAAALAGQMDLYGLPGAIQVTEATYARLKDTFLLERRGTFYIRGRGNTTTFLLSTAARPAP